CATVHAAPYFFGKRAASIVSMKPSSRKTRVVAGTSDSPTCSRGKRSPSKTPTLRPAFARYPAVAAPAGPPPMIPTSSSCFISSSSSGHHHASRGVKHVAGAVGRARHDERDHLGDFVGRCQALHRDHLEEVVALRVGQIPD